MCCVVVSFEPMLTELVKTTTTTTTTTTPTTFCCDHFAIETSSRSSTRTLSFLAKLQEAAGCEAQSSVRGLHDVSQLAVGFHSDSRLFMCYVSS